MGVLLAAKDLFWRMVPQKIGNTLSQAYFNRKKFKKQDFLLLNLYITGKCNLNCVGCNAFAPIADNYILEPVRFEADCKRLSELCVEKAAAGGAAGGIIPQIHIAGGEPLLHPELNRITATARRYFPRAKMKIVTNGILLLKQEDDFWECCRQNNADVIISHYPISLDIKSIRKKAKSYGITVRYYRGVLPWYKMGFDLTGGRDAEKNFRKCGAALQCVELRDGKIATCQYILKAAYFKNYFQKDIEIQESDSIDIYKARDMDEILEFISKPAPFCRYCTLEYLPVTWGQSKKDISEWA